MARRYTSNSQSQDHYTGVDSLPIPLHKYNKNQEKQVKQFFIPYFPQQRVKFYKYMTLNLSVSHSLY